MGLQFSAENVLGWRSQYEAMTRWFSRCQNVHLRDGRYTSWYDALDFVLVFFVHCYHLSDYVVETGGMSRKQIEDLIDNNKNMKICRDICLRVKHHSISNSSSVKRAIDKDWSIGREYCSEFLYGTSGEKLFLIVGDEKLDPLSIVYGCVDFWQDLVGDKALVESTNPFTKAPL